MLKVSRIPGLLFWNHKEVDCTTSEGMPQQEVGGLASKSEEKQAKGKASFFHVLLLGRHQKVWPRVSAALPVSNLTKKNLSQECMVAGALVDSRSSQVDSQDLPSHVYLLSVGYRTTECYVEREGLS